MTTSEQEAKLARMDDLELLCELAIAFGNNPGFKLDADNRARVMTIFDDLNLDHLSGYACASKERSDSKHGKSL